MDPIVNVEGLAYAHERAGHTQQILSDLTLELMAGKLVVLTGPSGSGKSTLLTIIGGLRRAKIGTVQVFGDQIVGSRERKLIRLGLFHDLAAAGSSVVLVTHDKRVIDQADSMIALEDGRLVPPADQFMNDTSNSLKKLMEIDPERLGRLMSLAQPLARVALADGTLDRKERESIVELLRQRQIFSGAELELVVDMAIAQAQAGNQASRSEADREALDRAVRAVAMADNVVTEEERAIVDELKTRQP
ncbi:MAG: ATP-binding cassette domain-containing protein [Pseudomonadales bacterium]|nr:ATP-binding cassette domain-containing protein [Pseudomonadales bacterium]NIX07897.1 ATP-binding cassette domain-containing protein [Pseudomonadales bacterium]